MELYRFSPCLLILPLALIAAPAKADIINLQSTQTCNVTGLDASPATAVGGVHCNTGNTAFSLQGILNGTLGGNPLTLKRPNRNENCSRTCLGPRIAAFPGCCYPEPTAQGVGL